MWKWLRENPALAATLAVLAALVAAFVVKVAPSFLPDAVVQKGDFLLTVVVDDSVRPVDNYYEMRPKFGPHVRHSLRTPAQTMRITWDDNTRAIDLGCGDIIVAFDANQLTALRGRDVKIKITKRDSKAPSKAGEYKRWFRMASASSAHVPKLESWDYSRYESRAVKSKAPRGKGWADLVFPEDARTIHLKYSALTLSLPYKVISTWVDKDVEVSLAVEAPKP